MARFIIQTVAALSTWAVLVTASPHHLRQTSDVEAFIAQQRPLSLQATLNNIGPNGSLVPGAGAGLVIASPSKANPDYFYTWSRDAALTMKTLVDEFLFGNADLEAYIDDYVHSQAVLQTVANPSGTLLPSGVGLGEPKYKADGTRFNGNWGRPQRDGPALRAIALITYSNWLLENGQKEKAKTIVWPVISNDLAYVGQYWNATGFDLWEEVSGSSFFTTQSQYRALAEGDLLAKSLGFECASCGEAPQVLCFLQSYWNGEYVTANINGDFGRSGKDANTILGPIAMFDIDAPCDSPTMQPCNPRGLANFKALVDTFRDPSLYPINGGIPRGMGVAMGRYAEDIYFGGNPWYLITFGAAEYLYDAIAQWKAQGSLTIDATSLGFFSEIYQWAEEKTYSSTDDSVKFSGILDALFAYADSFVAVGQEYTPQNGSLAEQFSKTSGEPLSAYALTWSFASFVSMSERRAGQYPPGWVSAAAPSVPAQCTASSVKGTYTPAIEAGAPDAPTTCTSTVVFAVRAPTYYGENLYLVGNTTDLGGWDIANAQPLAATNYTDANPVWFARIALAADSGAVSYGYARQQDCGQPVLFETVNRTLAVPPCDETAGDAVRARTDDVWTGPAGSSGNCE